MRKLLPHLFVATLICWMVAPKPMIGADSNDGATATSGSLVILGANDSGMHCIDPDYSIFAILPPGNRQRAQVVQKASGGGLPEVLTNQDVTVTYRAIADPSGSINTTSVNKTNFWDFVSALYGVSLKLNTGFQGQKMPGTANKPQTFSAFDAASNRFAAPGIPFTPVDNAGATSPYPLLQLHAKSATGGKQGAFLSSVVPVSVETHCSDCHATGKAAATPGFRGVTAWSKSSDTSLQARMNVLILHDAAFGTSLRSAKPVRCSSCHYSLATDTLVNGTPVGPNSQQAGQPTLSSAMHLRHGSSIDGSVPIPDRGIATCYECHPGRNTKCFRGAMSRAGLICQNCHGGLLAVGGQVPLTTTGQQRRPWVDLPTCEACHAGDANSHAGDSIILRLAYQPGDPSATPRIPTNTRFAAPSGVLFQNGLGHSGIACENCHGSPHAIWPTNRRNDNLAAKQLQGHAGMITECSVCHADTLAPTMDGPHGIHNIGDSGWIGAHPDFYGSDPDSCKACHGQMLEGTPLSRTAADRKFPVEDSKVPVAKGMPVNCGMCHENPIMGG